MPGAGRPPEGVEEEVLVAVGGGGHPEAPEGGPEPVVPGAAGAVGLGQAAGERGGLGEGLVHRHPGDDGHRSTTSVGGRSPDDHVGPATTPTSSRPTRSTSTATRSPGSMGPTPSGVPVVITSPGSNVITWET